MRAATCQKLRAIEARAVLPPFRPRPSPRAAFRPSSPLSVSGRRTHWHATRLGPRASLNPEPALPACCCLDRRHRRGDVRRSAFDWTALLVLFVLVYLPLSLSGPRRPQAQRDPQEVDEPDPPGAPPMATEMPPGRPGTLTADQEEKLRKLWGLVLHLCGVGEDEAGTAVPAADESGTTTPLQKQESTKAESQKPKKKRLGLFGRKDKKDKEDDAEKVVATVTSKPVIPVSIKVDQNDKYGETKQFFEALANTSPEDLRATIWSMVKHDHPDALLLRFLRARKWDVEQALVMMISTMNWRATEMHVDDDIMKNGEAGAVAAAAAPDGDAAAKRLGADFLAQIRMGKSFLHGVDKDGRPICVVRVRLHRQGEQVEESLERYTVYIIETARMLLIPPVDTATIIFDMTGFSLANMDYTPVKFMIKCFEANYPESLGAVLVHKAPWVFQGIWKIIRGWLDPVVASKVHFTNSMKEMEEFVSADRILKELDGNEDWNYQYVEPVPGENQTMEDTETRDRLLAAREELVKEYEAATLRWIKEPDSEKGAEAKAERTNVAARLRDDYWVLDPYLRARSLYDRTGVIKAGGKLDFYPGSAKVEEAPAAAAAPAAATAATPAATPAAAPAAAPATTNGTAAPHNPDDDVD